MISLNKFSFGSPENFVNAYVTRDGAKVIVKVKNKTLVYPKTLFHESLEVTGTDHYVFSIPREFWPDVLKIMCGKYSRITEVSKEIIRKNSGLDYKVATVEDGENMLNIDARLRALDREPLFRETLEEMLGTTIASNEELISPPQDDEFWKD